MNKKIYLIAIVYCASITASDGIDPTKYKGGVLGNYLYQASKNLVLVVDKAPDVANKVGSEILKGALEQIPAYKRREIGADLAAGFIDKMNTPEGHDAAYKLGENVVKGAAGGAVIVAGMAKDAVIAKKVATGVAAKGATVAASTTVKVAAVVAAPYVAGAAAVGVAGYGSYWLYNDYCEFLKPINAYSTCLNDNITSTDVNGRGLPRRCESPERKLAIPISGRDYSLTKNCHESNFKSRRARLQAALAKKET